MPQLCDPAPSPSPRVTSISHPVYEWLHGPKRAGQRLTANSSRFSVAIAGTALMAAYVQSLCARSYRARAGGADIFSRLSPALRLAAPAGGLNAHRTQATLSAGQV